MSGPSPTGLPSFRAARLLAARTARRPPHADATAQSAPTLAGERLQSGRSSAARGGGTRVRGRWQILAIVLGLAGVAAGGLALWMNRPSPAAVAPSASPCNEIPPFDGGWTFDTVILGGRPGREAGFGVRGHYRLELSGLTRSGQGACAMGGLLVKRGYTMNGKEYGPVLRARIAGRISPRGESMSYLARLARELPPADQDRPGAAPAPGTITADIAMRLARHGDALVGLWRHEGDDRERAGYWGALVGRRDAASAALPDDRCFSDCVRACHGDADPLDVATEGCLMRCAPKIDDCPR